MARMTLSRYLIEEHRDKGKIHGDLRLLIEVVSRACKAISIANGKGGLGGVLGEASSDNVQGEAQKKLDVLSNEYLLEANEWGGHLAAMASEEMDLPHIIPNAGATASAPPYDNFRREGPGFLYSFGGKLYLGVVDYDGQTQSSNPALDGIPLSTDVDYLGFTIEAIGGYRIGQRLGLDVFGGIGLDDWLRSLNDGRTSTGLPVYGYDEYYTILYGKAGLGFFQLLNSWRYMLQAGVKLPLITSEYVDAYDITLEPGIEPAACANIQFDFGSGRHNRFSVALYYDGYRFSETDAERVSATEVIWQPRSHMDVYGVQFGYYFFWVPARRRPVVDRIRSRLYWAHAPPHHQWPATRDRR